VIEVVFGDPFGPPLDQEAQHGEGFATEPEAFFAFPEFFILGVEAQRHHLRLRSLLSELCHSVFK
jgi:hypothetical protein